MRPPRDGDVSGPRRVVSALGPAGQAVAYEWNLVTDEIRWEASLADTIGLDAERLSTGLAWAEHLVAESPSSRYEAVMAGGADAGGGVAFRAVYGLRPARRSDAAPVWIEDEGRWFADAADRPVCVRGKIRLTTDPAEADRASAGLRDAATGAFTRERFVEHLARQLRLAGGRNAAFAVLAIGIEPLSGGDAGMAETDIAEVDMAEAFGRLREEMRVHEIIAREGARRFAALLESCNAEQAAAAAHRFIAAIERDAAPALRATIGAVLAPSQGRSPEELLRAAAEALDDARDMGGAYVLHEREAAGSEPTRDDVVSVLNEGRVVLALRPVVASATREPIFHEGLVRVVRADGRLTPGDDLKREAAAEGVATLLERRVLELAIGMLVADRRLKLSIDVSLAALGESAWLEHLRATARLRPDVTRRLTLEIAEADAVADVEASCAALAPVRSCGVKLALDDFGPAATSFRALRRLATNLLKIDASLLRGLGQDPVDRRIRDLVGLARNLSVPTVAQIVAGEGDSRALAKLGVDYVLGDLLAQPKPGPVASLESRARV